MKDSRKQITLRLPGEVYEALKETTLCGISFNALLNTILRKWADEFLRVHPQIE